jgi:SAM-dependent methyltransferase
VNVLYELLYLAGLRPWERSGVAPALRALVEGPEALPPGRALDIGCGTGGPSVYLATHGWDVTGVDVVGHALRLARARSAAAGVSLRLVQADVAQLADHPSIARGQDLLLDTGCYHGLGEAQRAAYAETAAVLAAPGAALLLFALTPGGPARPRAFRGASGEELLERFGNAWALAWERPHPGRPVFPGAGQRWFLLRRRSSSSSALPRSRRTRDVT